MKHLKTFKLFESHIEDMEDTSNEEELVYDDSYLKYREKEEFWSALEGEMGSWFDKRLKENEVKVYKAIIMLFQESENIEIFNKKAIYLYLREITGMNTKQIVSSLSIIRREYNDFREKWESGDV